MICSASAVKVVSSPRTPPTVGAGVEVGVGVAKAALEPVEDPGPTQGEGPGSASMAGLTSSCLGTTSLPDDDNDDDDGRAERDVFFAGLLVI